MAGNSTWSEISNIVKRGQILKGLVSHAVELIFIVSAIAKHWKVSARELYIYILRCEL